MATVKTFQHPEYGAIFISIHEDITERKRAADELHESEERFRFIVEQSPLSIQILDPSGRTIKVSKSFENLWGLSLEDLQTYNILNDQQLEILGLMSYLKKAFAGETVELPVRDYDSRDSLGRGFKRSVRSIAFPIKNREGRVNNIVLIHEDVTERK